MYITLIPHNHHQQLPNESNNMKFPQMRTKHNISRPIPYNNIYIRDIESLTKPLCCASRAGKWPTNLLT